MRSDLHEVGRSPARPAPGVTVAALRIAWRGLRRARGGFVNRRTKARTLRSAAWRVAASRARGRYIWTDSQGLREYQFWEQIFDVCIM
jgi:hypothetical protein